MAVFAASCMHRGVHPVTVLAACNGLVFNWTTYSVLLVYMACQSRGKQVHSSFRALKGEGSYLWVLAPSKMVRAASDDRMVSDQKPRERTPFNINRCTLCAPKLLSMLVLI